MLKEKNSRRPAILGNTKVEIGGQKIKDNVADYDAEGTDTLNEENDNKKKDPNGN